MECGGGVRAGKEAWWGACMCGEVRTVPFIGSGRFALKPGERTGGPDGAGKRAFGRQAARRGPVGCALGHSTRRAQAPRCIGACEASGGAARALLAWGTQLPRQTVGRHAAGVRA